MVKFFTLEFFKQISENVNRNPDFEIGIGDFDGTIILAAKDLGKSFLIEIRRGKIRSVKEVKPYEKSDFKLEGNYENWVKVGKGELMVRDAILTGALSLTGSLVGLAMYAGGFGVLLQTMASTPKEF
ncbi:MAG: SCP2 sterol-binding domain-containing protein [Candidatus Bathyarchaeota archaeon]|nr:SCP2 sterol-binding domain-containing protein [Candidatus Bathyarchaeota archaeon]